MEWDEPRARYPNLWRDGMPAHVLASARVASRLRLGDLIAVFYPAGTKHPERSNRFVGLSSVSGLRRADRPGHAWIDLETEHRFDPGLEVEPAPRRVFMCCDPGWPEADVEIFQRVFDAAIAAGYSPPGKEPPAAPEKPAAEPAAAPPAAEPAEEAAPEPAVVDRVEPSHDNGDRLFAGADYSGDMRDPRDQTWLAVVALSDGRIRVRRLAPTGRSGLQTALRDPDRDLMRAEAIGLGFPFGLPLPFAESLLGGAFPEEGWWALARKLEKMSWPDYLTALHEFRDAKGEPQRHADERAGTQSPLRRVDPDLGSRFYHGIRMIAEDRSRYAIKPFESAQGRTLFEVSPHGALRKIGIPDDAPAKQAVRDLEKLEYLPVEMGERERKRCLERRDALNAVVAARCAAIATLTDETTRTPEELAPDNPDLVRREGWVYGLKEPAA